MQGLIQLAEHREELKVVITDLHMPNMSGKAFVSAFRKTLPEVPVIVSSGNISDGDLEAFRAMGVTQFLDKPFTEGQLGQALQAVLQGGE